MKSNNEDHISINQLSEQRSVDKRAVSITVHSLATNDLVERKVHDENGIVTNLILTQPGKNVCQKINKGNDEYYSIVLGSIPAEDLRSFLKAFEKIIEQMKMLNRGEDFL